jgi:hypothetical protein
MYKFVMYEFKMCSNCLLKSICSEDCDDALLDECKKENVEKLTDDKLVELGRYVNSNWQRRCGWEDWSGELYSEEWDKWFDERYGGLRLELSKRGYEHPVAYYKIGDPWYKHRGSLRTSVL